ncbi:hypothetical protein G7Z17_g5772 [Cylindrodendrum hubeiense]|uniref:C2H2-type domain-containing protein n=1 Tax=Cylindrodendrum hubeiense TaxID=595255 RepID=A0A9P5HBF2_9HYPO|nr:hypothetical protein G7Z17_g5772 [Cylindrodendrum hubeiense]
MRFLLTHRPLLAAVAGIARPAFTPVTPLGAQLANALVQGRRNASVKTQGAYRKKSKRGIPKKLGCKRTGVRHSRQHPLQAARHALVARRELHHGPRPHDPRHATGYVKYYRDPVRHPDRKYIGVVFDKADTLPYPVHAETKRKLNKTVFTIRPVDPKPELSPSGIPFQVTRVEAGEPDRILKLRKDYSYREDNWRIGRLVQTTGLKTKRFRTRKQWFRHRRWRRERELEGQRKADVKRAENGGGDIKMAKPVSKKAAKKAAKKNKNSIARVARLAQRSNFNLHQDLNNQHSSSSGRALATAGSPSVLSPAAAADSIERQSDQLLRSLRRMALVNENWPQYHNMQDDTPIKKIKRTKFSSWSSGIMGSSSSKATPGAASLPKKDGPSPEPARIVSDLVAQAAQGGGMALPAGMSTHPRILATQAAWEKGQLGDGSPAAGGLPIGDAGAEKGPAVRQAAQTAAPLVGREPSGVQSASATPSATPVPLPNQKKRFGDGAPSSEPPPNKKLQTERRLLPSEPVSTSKGHNSVRAEARRFTDAAVTQHMAGLSGNLDKKPQWQKGSPIPEGLFKMIKNGSFKNSVTPASLKSESHASQSMTTIKPKATPPPAQSTTSTKPNTAATLHKPNPPASHSTLSTNSKATPPVTQSTTSAKSRTATPPHNADPTSHPTFWTDGKVPAAPQKTDQSTFQSTFQSAPLTQTKVPLPQIPVAPAPSHFTAATTSTTNGKSAPKVGERITAIPLAESGRLYISYPESNGASVSARGALIPANYKKHGDPEYSFICPVRDCRRLFPSLKGLGGHFAAGHNTLTFNDNGDGTLSKVGSYVNHGPGGTPGIVVSRHALPPDAPPPVDPGLSFFAARTGPAPKPTPIERPSLRPSTNSALSQPKGFRGLGSEVRDYLHRFLVAKQRTYKREDVRFMITLPRKRNLPDIWIECHRDSELDSTHYACALAFLTGDEITGPDKCVSHVKFNARPTSRLSTPCIKVPENMHISAKKLFSNVLTCVGCKYWSHLQRRINQCDWSPHPRLSRSGSPLSQLGAEDETSKLSMTEMDEPDPVVEPEPEPEPESDEESVHDLRRRRRRLAAPESAPASTPAMSVSKVESRPVEAAGQLSGLVLEMEQWEVAPGRMTDESSQNIAFSNSYLTHGQPVAVSEDISFNVLVIKPGSSNHWPVEENKLRTVSVAAGKVGVTMNEQTFQLGPNGMFVVRPGQTCKVDNRLYVDSVVHCTTIADFGLQ